MTPKLLTKGKEKRATLDTARPTPKPSSSAVLSSEESPLQVQAQMLARQAEAHAHAAQMVRESARKARADAQARAMEIAHDRVKAAEEEARAQAQVLKLRAHKNTFIFKTSPHYSQSALRHLFRP